ncbi:metal ABC transporter ATP-binding protein [Chryseomicrobium sp. FSL W7-1435]|uniref:metal ABC transporter ATP-binding protein n=1 Tax=Chryseomicrobium sp. FSL W7-1435 TaxID=2921704 RepID=UPI00315AF82D
MTPYIEMKNVSFYYDKTEALQNVSLTINEGDFLAVIGPNGSGKSTLMKIILGLLRPMKGEVALFGKPVQEFKDRACIGYVSQKSTSFNSGFPATVFEVVRSGLAKKSGLFTRYPKNVADQIKEALISVGMQAYIDRPISALSGGQQQRVFIARALISKPKILLLDEPTVGIDQQNMQSFYRMLTHLNKHHGITIILITHDVDAVSNSISHVACLNRTIHFHGYQKDMEALSNEQLEEWYGHPVRRVTHGGSSHA